MEFLALRRHAEKTRILAGLPYGLRNDSSACFLNSTIHLLGSVATRLRAVANHDLQILLESVNLAGAYDVEYRVTTLVLELIRRLALFNMSTAIQHDAHEVLLVILNNCIRSEPTPPFVGRISRRKTCIRCGAVGVLSEENFSVLSISIDKPTLKGCVDALSKAEVVNNVECDACTLIARRDRCLAVNTLFSRTFIHHTNLLNFESLPVRTAQLIKCDINLWPEILFLRVDRASSINGTKSQLEVSIPEKMVIDGSVYELLAVTLHIGNSSERGHYVTLRRWDASVFGTDCKPEWILADDERVTFQTRNVIGSELVKRNAYLLIFNRN